MKFAVVLGVVLPVLVGAGLADRAAAAPPLVLSVNHHWTFNYFPAGELDPAPAGPRFDDDAWPVVALPHTWSTYETTGDLHPFIKYVSEKDDPYWWNGWGWYRKRFVPAPEWAGKRVFVEFDGVMKYSRIYLNGVFIGEHKGGYCGFSLDLTDHIRLGEENLLVVAVHNRRDDLDRIPPMDAGNFNVYGGIYRQARLVVKDPLHFPFQGSPDHEGGLFVTTPEVSEASATVRVRAWLRNDGKAPRECTLRVEIADAFGRTVAQLRDTCQIPAGATHAFDLLTGPVAHPSLWSPGSPYLYSVAAEAWSDGRLADACTAPLGFRWFRWDYGENRFYLNGRRVDIHGANRVQDYPWLGDAMPHWLLEADMHDIRDNLAHNFIRGNVYPNDPLFYNLCDRLGIVVCDAVPNIKRIDFSEEVQERQLRGMIRLHRNHPSVMFYSMGNETDDAADSRWAHEEDPTRIIHQRHIYNDSAGDYAPLTDRNIDLEELLRCTVRGWTHADVAPYQPVNCQHTGHEEWQHERARVWNGSQRGRIDMATGVMWMYADSGADREYRNCPLLHINPKGWVDLYRVPKYMYTLWQANYLERLMVAIHPHYWTVRYLGTRQDIVVDSNGERVELFVNGRSLGVRHPSGENFHTVTFEGVEIARGSLSARAVKDGASAEHVVHMPGPPARITLVASHASMPAARDSVAVVTLDVVDAAGVHAEGATPTLRWSVSGPATLVGPDACASDIDRREEMEGTMYTTPPVKNLVRATGEPGVIVVHAESDGLSAGQARIVADAVEPDGGPILQPPLRLAGRRPVERVALAATGRELPKPLPELREDFNLPAGLARGEYATRLRRILRDRYPGIESAGLALDVLLVHLSEVLSANSGLLVADDFNFALSRFNDCLAVVRALEAAPVPESFRQSQIKYYARRMLRDGRRLELRPVLERIARLPADATAVVACSDRLADVVAATYPAFARLPRDARERYLLSTQSVNTYVDARAGTVERGRVVLLPALPPPAKNHVD